MSSDHAAASCPDPRLGGDPAALARALERRVLPLVSRPARYVGGEAGAEPAAGWRAGGVNALLCFPDAYEVGMSHTGLRILYTLLNQRADAFADLAFAPWPDMEAAMRREGLPLFGLQTRRAARQFDLIGFSLGYELCYTNMLTMLDLAGLALRAEQRRDGDPLVIAGGSCTMNPTVIGPFCDAVLPGDGEEVLGEVVTAVAAGRRAGHDRAAILAAVRAVPGVWWPGADGPVTARVLRDLNAVPMPRDLVPVTEPVHDRLAIEVMRGCARGCRFCQAGMIQRPVRERDVAAVVAAGAAVSRGSGQDEVGLLSLSTSDYSGLGAVVGGLREALAGSHTNLVLPSLRMDALDPAVREQISRERPSSVTFAPEAGTQRLRDVINKQLTEPEILEAAAQAMRSGIKRIKLYFMIGLPTETDQDLEGIVALVERLAGLDRRGSAQITVSVSPFAPKAHTPFQWAGQIPRAEIDRRNHFLAQRLRPLRVKVSLREPEVSYLEAALGLGDARLADVIEAAWRDGARFDGWDECFDWDRWLRALKNAGVDGDVVVGPRDPAAPLPWDVVVAPVSRAFLRAEWEQALAAATTPECKLVRTCTACAACGGGLGHVLADLAPSVACAPAAPDAPMATPPPVDPPAPPADEHPRWRSWRERASAKVWCRIEFAKTGRGVFLGHLDFQRQLQLALRRSGLPVAYSKGYHPHPLAKYGPPLAVGVAGERELLDLAFQWIEPDWLARLGAALPPELALRRGVVAGSATPPSIDAMVERCDYRVVLPDAAEGGPDPDAARAATDAFLAAGHWPHRRQRLDRPDVDLDVRRLVLEDGLVWQEQPGSGAPVLDLRLLRDIEGQGLPAHDVLAAIFGDLLAEPRWCAVTRTGLWGRDTRGRWLTPLDAILDERQRCWLRAHLYD